MIKHGDYTDPVIEILGLADTPPVAPDSTALNGMVQRYDKRVPVSLTPSALNNVSAIHHNGICIRDSAASPQTRGVALLFPTLSILSIMFFADEFAWIMIYDFGNPSVGGMVFWLLIFYLMIFVFPKLMWAYMSLDLFPPEDLPIIFDRKHRKIYKLVLPLDGSSERGWARFRRIHLQAIEYDWDLVTAEHRVELSGTASSITRCHRLMMVVRDRPKPGEEYGRLLDEFSVGSSASLGEESTKMWWEHLRRYMQTNGPGVPKGEPLHVFERPKTLWQSMGVVSPFGPRFMWWWQAGRFPVILMLVLSPFTLPFFTGWAICNWISHKTMREVVWPQEVLDRIGPVVRRAE